MSVEVDAMVELVVGRVVLVIDPKLLVLALTEFETSKVCVTVCI
jgi:hypothetical protein